MADFTEDQTRAWRASYLTDAAKRLEKQADEMRARAKRYRETANKIRTRQGCTNTPSPDGRDPSPF